jgi:hypothetical protein
MAAREWYAPTSHAVEKLQRYIGGTVRLHVQSGLRADEARICQGKTGDILVGPPFWSACSGKTYVLYQ